MKEGIIHYFIDYPSRPHAERVNPDTTKYDKSRLQSILLADQLTGIGNEMSIEICKDFV